LVALFNFQGAALARLPDSFHIIPHFGSFVKPFSKLFSSFLKESDAAAVFRQLSHYNTFVTDCQAEKRDFCQFGKNAKRHAAFRHFLPIFPSNITYAA